MSDKVPPFLRAAMLCSHVHFDDEGRPYDLIEPYHTVMLSPTAQWPLTMPELYLYVQIEDGIGTFGFSVEVRNEEGFVTHRTTPVPITLDGTTARIVPHEPCFRIHGLAFPGPGRYDFLLLCNHLSLHAREGAVPAPFLRVLPT